MIDVLTFLIGLGIGMVTGMLIRYAEDCDRLWYELKDIKVDMKHELGRLANLITEDCKVLIDNTDEEVGKAIEILSKEFSQSQRQDRL